MIRTSLKTSPLEIFTRLYDQFDYAYILESVEGPEKLAEYSFLGFEPRTIVSVKNGKLEVYDRDEGEKIGEKTSDPLPLLKKFVVDAGVAHGGFRFMGGAVGYISYDAIRYWEKIAENATDVFGFPDLEMGIYRDGLIFDHKKGEFLYFHHGENRLNEIETIAEEPSNPSPLICSQPKVNLEKKHFEDMVRKSKEYIVSGDVFQVVLSKRYEFNFHGSLVPFYVALRQINPSSHMYFLKMGSRQIVGSSPEMLMRVEGRDVETFPIAGTRPRDKGNREADEALALELTRDPKEQAEHVMLVDLARNDLGRISEYGSVNVQEFMRIYKYSHVQHLVSRVTGKLKDGCDSYDALKAVFPAGTVSGAPKLRAMEIIEELEPVRRGPYAGAVGYFSCNGNADFAITIRTLVAEGNRAYVQAGAGIVADSEPEREWLETEHKAKAILKALKIAAEGGQPR
ncbi:MAG: anthranilate synthase component I [Candidatus Hadarchaeum sp.]|uniref:anthranilate synthase component I n=1 Tax=Candidatus Hadarchaeum sp. TaxID=2883567 RepID=UPI003D1108FD